MNRSKIAVFFVFLLMAACSDPEPETVFYISEDEPDVSVPGQTDTDTTEDAVTVTEPDSSTESATRVVDGESCTMHSDCQGGTCLGGSDWSDGYCTTLNCQTRDDCASNGEDNQCLQSESSGNFCVRVCNSTDECRKGYVCSRIGRGTSICLSDAVNPVDPGGTGSGSLTLSCKETSNRQVTLEYDISPDTVAYMVTPISREGRRLTPDMIQTPSGQTIDLRRENAFQSVPAELFVSMNPTIIPATAQFAHHLESGRHTYQLQTDSDEVCHYLLEEKTLGTVMDLEIYLAGVPDITATSAPEDPNMGSVLAHFEEIFLQAGVRVGKVNFHDIDGANRDRYSIIRSERDVMNLVALSKTPKDALSMNIFFVKQFAFSDGGGTIGISMGLPGPAGLHGSFGSGVVFTSEYMNTTFREGTVNVDGDDFTGIVLAHEVGHYLGLFHTSEQYGMGFDPLPDTPQCGRNSFPNRCPDLGNLMFPIASIHHTTVTEDQAWVIRVNPLTKD